MSKLAFFLLFLLHAWHTLPAKNRLESPQNDMLTADFGIMTIHHQTLTKLHVVNLSPNLLDNIVVPDDIEWRFYKGSRPPTDKDLQNGGRHIHKHTFSNFAFKVTGFGVTADDWTGEGWFISKFCADSILPFTNRLTIWIPRQFGDSKLFLDGKPLQTFALNSTLPRRNILAFITLDSGDHELAVQYRDDELITLSRQFGFFSGFTGLSLVFGTEQSVLTVITRADRIDRGFFGACIALILLVALHLLFFLFSPSEKVHFFYALQTLCLAQMYLPDSTAAEIFGDVRFMWGMQNILSNSLRMMILPAVVAMLTSLLYPHSLSKRHKIALGVLFGITLGGLVIQIVYPLYFHTQAHYILHVASITLPSFLCLIEISRLMILGIRRNHNLLWLASGGVFLLIAAVLGLGRIFVAGTSSVSFGLPFIVAGVGFQIGMSLFLAWQSAQTRRNLALSLEQVQMLSAQMLEQERRAALLQLQKERERFRAESLAREAAFTALKMQINPHFLFNALASIRTLSRIQPEIAQEAISQLSSLFRYALQSAKQETVSLREELRIVRDYLALEGLRFEDRLQSHFSIPPELENIPIPPMTLQILVENAVKHGIENERNGGTISITAALEDSLLQITVCNTGKLREESEGNRIGLHNARERLRLIFGTSADIVLEEHPDAEKHYVCAEVRYNPSLLHSSALM